MKNNKSIKKDDIVPRGLKKAVVAQEITPDFVLELYEKSKTLKGKRKKDMLTVAEELSKHVGKWLVE
jgi:hypothetical protein